MSIVLTEEQKHEVYLQVLREKNAAIRAANPEEYARKNREHAKKFYERNREAILQKHLLKRIEAGVTPNAKSLRALATTADVQLPPEKSRNARERRYQERKAAYEEAQKHPVPQVALAEP